MTEWHHDIKLPLSARSKLASPVQEAVNVPLHIFHWHTLPVHEKIWEHYAEQIKSDLEKFHENCVKGPDAGDYNSVRTWLHDLLAMRDRVFSITLALAPFEFFDEDGARAMLGSLDLGLLNLVRTKLLGMESLPLEELSKASADWVTVAVEMTDDPLARAFGIDSSEIYDEDGQFSPGRVFSSYYLRSGELLQVVLPHLGSLGLPEVGDLLVAVSIVGWILTCEDPIAAYCSMDAMLKALSNAHGTEVERLSLKYLERSEPELRQGRLKINRILTRIRDEPDEELRHLALADLYKRLIEGPFRKYGWILHCLKAGRWSHPPMLTQLRDALVSQGGWLGSIAERTVIRDMRNGEAHETLFWDGIEHRFVAEEVTVEPYLVGYAAVLADSFGRGCEAAVACHRTLEAEYESSRPRRQDPGRLSPWQRAEAIFGTNGIRLMRANFNSKIAKVVCLQLAEHDINPCLQSLVVCHGLLPHVEQFEVATVDSNKSVIVVSRDALERTVPVWEMAVENLTSMPFSTFLPANLDSRSRSEEPSRAARAVAWIAVDDFLDALDGSAKMWDEEEIKLFVVRASIIIEATGRCISALPPQSQVRLRAVQETVSEFLIWLRKLSAPIHWSKVSQVQPVHKIRHWWDEWGPVDRHPSIKPTVKLPGYEDHRSKLRDAPGDLRWRTI